MLDTMPALFFSAAVVRADTGRDSEIVWRPVVLARNTAVAATTLATSNWS